MRPLLLIAALLVSSAHAADAPPVRLALIEDSPTRTNLTLAQPLERVLREAGKDAALIDVENVPVYFGGSDYRFRLPPGPGAPAADTSSAAALEGDSEVVFVFPDVPDLVEALRAAAADSKTFRIPDSVRLSPAEAEFAATTGPDGETLLHLRARLERPATGRVRSGLAGYYRLRWKGQDAAVAVVGRTFGGLGRLGAAAEAERERRPFTGLARGLSFGSPYSDAPGREVLAALERAGLKYSAVNEFELAHWKELTAYAAEKPDGVRWLSANLVYSTAPSVTVLPPYAVFEASGTRVAVVALTPQWTQRLLKGAGLAAFKVLDPIAALEPLIPRLRAEADIVVALAGTADSARLSTSGRGLDLVLGDNTPYLTLTSLPSTIVEQDDRPVFANAFPRCAPTRPR
ncbi:MAG: hypothetical protein M0D55_20660 [Elusimicrobiota bacterium]|nr:MAG: hypothetical protein M0D55_20660 [Elusimicrobiota bacterium]